MDMLLATTVFIYRGARGGRARRWPVSALRGKSGKAVKRSPPTWSTGRNRGPSLLPPLPTPHAPPPPRLSYMYMYSRSVAARIQLLSSTRSTCCAAGDRGKQPTWCPLIRTIPSAWADPPPPDDPSEKSYRLLLIDASPDVNRVTCSIRARPPALSVRSCRILFPSIRPPDARFL